MFRIGYGYDVHCLEPGRELILGGVNIPHSTGLDGHSDADVVIHALMDAMLGALAAGDLGAWFPPSDPRFKGADSIKLLAKIWKDEKYAAYELGNCDITIVAQQPKLSPYILRMRENISKVLNCRLCQVSVKATTTEGLGFCGRQQGIAASAVVLLKKKAREE
ncbi:MAG: 2-C-methyl-D-erythritol 2,4-cyclodiphosphate synthase [Victivallaceae bacterium]|nr:2-C-methyl-D-erythritol 2,4-cyclodiphosphate synthase [Victivallaceae bacterium]